MPPYLTFHVYYIPINTLILNRRQPTVGIQKVLINWQLFWETHDLICLANSTGAFKRQYPLFIVRDVLFVGSQLVALLWSAGVRHVLKINKFYLLAGLLARDTNETLFHLRRGSTSNASFKFTAVLLKLIAELVILFLNWMNRL